jgi:hypothetical protein
VVFDETKHGPAQEIQSSLSELVAIFERKAPPGESEDEKYARWDAQGAEEDKVMTRIIDCGKQGMQEAAASALFQFTIASDMPMFVVRISAIDRALLLNFDPKIAGFVARQLVQYMTSLADNLAVPIVDLTPGERGAVHEYASNFGVSDGENNQGMSYMFQSAAWKKVSPVDLRESCDNVEPIIGYSSLEAAEKVRLTNELDRLRSIAEENINHK